MTAARDELAAIHTVLQRTDTRWRRGMAAHSLVWGLGYIFGPAQWSSSGSLDVIRSLGVPFAVHGVLIAALGVTLLTSRRQQAHKVAFIFWLLWAVGLALAVPTGSIVAWGGWLHACVVAAVHRHLAKPRLLQRLLRLLQDVV